MRLLSRDANIIVLHGQANQLRFQEHHYANIRTVCVLGAVAACLLQHSKQRQLKRQRVCAFIACQNHFSRSAGDGEKSTHQFLNRVDQPQVASRVLTCQEVILGKCSFRPVSFRQLVLTFLILGGDQDTKNALASRPVGTNCAPPPRKARQARTQRFRQAFIRGGSSVGGAHRAGLA